MEWLLGHLLGDYIFQTDNMAKGKTKPGMDGNYWCSIHCLVYTMCIMLMTKTTSINTFHTLAY